MKIATAFRWLQPCLLVLIVIFCFHARQFLPAFFALLATLLVVPPTKRLLWALLPSHPVLRQVLVPVLVFAALVTIRTSPQPTSPKQRDLTPVSDTSLPNLN